MTIQYYGMLSLPHSWAVVATSILVELQKQNIKINAVSTNSNDTIHPLLRDSLTPPVVEQIGNRPVLVQKPLPTEVSLSYTIPPNLSKVPAKHRIHIYNYETTKMPPGWASIMNNHAHLILPSSNFSKQIFKMNGIAENRMAVVPHGYDPEIYNPNIAPANLDNISEDKFKFLTVAIGHWRKGYDLLLKAYLEEFKGDDSVVLIIKCSTDPREGNSPCKVDLNKLLEQFKKSHKYQWPEIRIITQRFENLASLYRAADAVVLPSRAECFSLTVLEAAACKVPVITTDYGGHLDFLNYENSYLIDYKLRQAPREAQYWHYDKDALIAEPDVEHLKQLMREIKNNQQAAKQKAELAYSSVQHLHWSKVANQVLELIKERNWKV